jgi:predicted TIM-barrel fold metal-dependent hydrolase
MGVASAAIPTQGLPNLIGQSAALAKYPNVSVKLSASPLFSSEPYPFRDMAPHIRRLFDAFGPRRCYWGTDITNSLAKATYRQRITHFTETLISSPSRTGLGNGPRDRAASGLRR